MDIVFQDFIMQMHARGLSRIPYGAYLLSPFHLLALPDGCFVEMCIPGLVAIAVVNDHQIAITPFVTFHVSHHAITRGVGIRTQGSREVNPAMELLHLINRVRTIAEKG